MSSIKFTNKTGGKEYWMLFRGNGVGGVVGSVFEYPSESVGSASHINNGDDQTKNGLASDGHYTLIVFHTLGFLNFPSHILGGYGPFTPGAGMRIEATTVTAGGNKTLAFDVYES